MAVRNAQAEWKGSLKKGNGHMKFANYDGPFTWASRFDTGPGTNPEELIGAAIAGCFSMALSEGLGDAGHVVETIKTTAKVSVEPRKGGGFSITGIALDTVANIPQISDEDFQPIADNVKKNCPVARALSVPITLKARLS